MEIEQLKLLNLTTYEAKVLYSLLHKGVLKVSQITKESNVPNGQIYNTLDSLEEKNLINIIPDNVKKYQAKSITYIKELIENKKDELKELEIELEKIKKIENKRIDGEIMIARGKKGFHKMILEWNSMSLGNSPYVYEIKWKADVNDLNIKKIANDVKKKGKIKKVLYDYNTPKENIKKWQEIIPKYHFIEANEIAMSITSNSTLISILDLNSTILIKSKSFSNTLSKLYEGYYELQEIKNKQIK